MSTPQALRILFSALAILVLCAPNTEAQLAPALWQESISLEIQTIDTFLASYAGSDPYFPEPHTELLSGAGDNVSGSITFGTEAPPVGTAMVTWDIGPGGASLQLNANVNIDFQVRVVETSTPPVSVETVPVHLVAEGSANVTEIFGARATSFFRYQPIGVTIISENLDVYGDPEAQSTATEFSIDETTDIPPDTIIIVGMSATAGMGTVGTGGSATGSATGMVDPIIEIVDETIPGTSSSYRDYFALEFSDGYDAQTPTVKVTMSEIKKRFSDPR